MRVKPRKQTAAPPRTFTQVLSIYRMSFPRHSLRKQIEQLDLLPIGSVD